MKRLIVAAMTICLGASLSFGQDVVPGVGAGSKAMLFSFGGLSFLSAGSFDGGVGARYFLSDAMSVRAGLQFTAASQTFSANPGTGQAGADGSASATVIGLEGAAEWHMGKGRVIPYMGLGAGFSTTSTDSKPTVTGVAPLTQSETKNSAGGLTVNGTGYAGGTSIQVFALAGIEFFLYKEVSLSAEYQLGYMSTSRKDQVFSPGGGAPSTTTKVGSGSNIGITNSGLLTLAVYF
ncbi:MAG TPA: outer membrane beta-barrel protein [Bacteroidota bacterium]